MMQLIPVASSKKHYFVQRSNFLATSTDTPTRNLLGRGEGGVKLKDKARFWAKRCSKKYGANKLNQVSQHLHEHRGTHITRSVFSPGKAPRREGMISLEPNKNTRRLFYRRNTFHSWRVAEKLFSMEKTLG